MEFWRRWWDRVAEALLGSDAGRQRLIEAARGAAPILWLIGKTGAGKTAIVSALTGDPRAEVGAGFAPCTREARFYDAPPEAPILRFLDTRGLEEPGYDPAEDIAWCEAQAHLLLAVMQLQDPDQSALLRVLRAVRQRHADWPLVVAQTGLHRLYKRGATHPPEGSPPSEDVERALAQQRALFERLPGPAPVFVPLDFTEAEDGLVPRLYGLAALEAALAATLPDAVTALHAARADAGGDRRLRHARQSLYAYAALSAGAGAMPVPWLGAAGLAALQAAMLQALARSFGVDWTRPLFARFAGALGVGTLGWFALRYGLTEAAKLIPGLGTIGAGAANAAFAAAFTAGTGEAALVLLRAERRGQHAPTEDLRRAYAEGFRAWRARAA
jgi:uncharacterized protein (DUF697 family)/predicted GTPase